MVSVILLTVAIIPMGGMFDMGLRSATTGSNYDKGRSLAIKQMELAKSLPYADARDYFPGTTTTTYGAGGNVTVSDQTDPDLEYEDFRYDVTKQYVQLVAPGGSTTNMEFTDVNSATADGKMVRITVTARWGGAAYNDKSFTTTGVLVE